MKRNQLLLVVAIVGIGFIGIVVYSIYTTISRTGKESVKVYIVPEDAQVTANGQKINSGTAYLEAGKYTIEGKKDGFENYKEEVTIGSPNNEIIDVALPAVSDSAKEWAKKNQKLYLEREGRGGERARERGDEFHKLNPITTKLPVSNVLYTISYTMDPTDFSGNSIILQVTAPAGYREGVLNKIRDLGYDPTNFKINFKVYENPFDNE